MMVNITLTQYYDPNERSKKKYLQQKFVDNDT